MTIWYWTWSKVPHTKSFLMSHIAWRRKCYEQRKTEHFASIIEEAHELSSSRMNLAALVSPASRLLALRNEVRREKFPAKDHLICLQNIYQKLNCIDKLAGILRIRRGYPIQQRIAHANHIGPQPVGTLVRSTLKCRLLSKFEYQKNTLGHNVNWNAITTTQHRRQSPQSATSLSLINSR